MYILDCVFQVYRCNVVTVRVGLASRRVTKTRPEGEAGKRTYSRATEILCHPPGSSLFGRLSLLRPWRPTLLLLPLFYFSVFPPLSSFPASAILSGISASLLASLFQPLTPTIRYVRPLLPAASFPLLPPIFISGSACVRSIRPDFLHVAYTLQWALVSLLQPVGP